MKTTNAKMTRIQALAIAIENVNHPEAVEILTAIQSSIEKANSRKSTGISKKSVESEAILISLLEKLNKYDYLSYSDLDINFQEISNQKFTALMKKAVENGDAEKGKADNKKVGYKLI